MEILKMSKIKICVSRISKEKFKLLMLLKLNFWGGESKSNRYLASQQMFFLSNLNWKNYYKMKLLLLLLLIIINHYKIEFHKYKWFFSLKIKF